MNDLLSGANFLQSALLQQLPQADKLNAKAFESAAAFAQSLTQWEFIIVGGSLLILIGTGYYRPKHVWIRCSYVLFVPGWVLSGLSIYFGIRVQEAYLAYLLVQKTTAAGISQTMNSDASYQISLMEWGLLVFGVWLLVYLCYWITSKEVHAK